MSLVLAVTLVMSVFGGLTAFAADATSIPKDYTVEGAVEDGNDAYGWKVDDKTLKIYYTGKPVTYSSSDYKNRPWKDSADKIEEVVIEGTPTEIGARTFKGMKSLTKVTYSDEAEKTVTKINTEAFAETSINGVFRIPASVTYLHGQSIQSTPISALVFESSTTPIELYKGLTYLGDLTSIVLMRPAKITGSITTVKQFGGTYASGTYGMTAPSRINMLISDASYIEPFSKLTVYEDYSKDVPSDKVGNIASKEFSMAPGTFGKYTLIDSTEAILDGVFADNVWYLLYDENTNPDSVDYTVEFLTNGKEKGDNMTTKGYSYNTSTKQYTIKNEQLANVAAKIKKMVFGFGFTQLQSCFGTNKGINDLYEKGKHTRYENLREVVFPAQFEKIWEFAFCNIRTLKKVNFEDTAIHIIDKKAFAYCPLETVKLPATITTIGEMAFVGNTALETLYLPSSASLKIDKGGFAREFNQPGFDNKTLKVIADGPQFAVGTNNVVDSSFDYDSNITVDKAWRDTVIIYNSEDTWTNTNSLGLGNGVSAVADKYYEMHDKDNDGKISLWMFNYAAAQPYSMFVATYDGSTLGTVEMLANDELAIGTLLDEDFDVSSKIGNKPAKVFLWNGFLNISPLHSAVEKNIE